MKRPISWIIWTVYHFLTLNWWMGFALIFGKTFPQKFAAFQMLMSTVYFGMSASDPVFGIAPEIFIILIVYWLIQGAFTIYMYKSKNALNYINS